jgi:ADP-ribose pyrophosphatase YjhB (NUDIX family)
VWTTASSAPQSRWHTHLPGGRLEPNETCEQALRCEVLEETGLALENARYLGFLHYRHLSQQPKNYAYPYPHVFHVVFAATASGVLRSGDVDGWEKETFVVSLQEARALPGSDLALSFIDAAVSARR